MEYFTLPFVNRRWFLMALILIGLAGCSGNHFGMQPSAPTSDAERMAMLRADLKRNPDNIEALREIGDLEASRGYWSQAMGAYREALLVDPGEREARLGFGEAQLALGDYTGALQTGQQAGGSDVRVALLEAGALTGMNQFGEARQVLDRAGAADPRNLNVRSNIAIVGGLSGDPQAYAIARAAAFAPDSTYTHRRNLVLVGGMTGYDDFALEDGAQLGLGPEEIGDIIAVGRRARIQGMSAFSILADR